MNRTVNDPERWQRVTWDGPNDASVTIEPSGLEGYVALYAYGPIHHAEVRIPTPDFIFLVETAVANILAAQETKP